VPAGGRDLQRPPGLGLPPHLSEVHPVLGWFGWGAGIGLGRIPRAAEEPGDLGQATDADDPQPLDQRGLTGVRRGHHDTFQAGSRRRDGHREHARGGHQATLQR
jgi:hypothetical protein